MTRPNPVFALTLSLVLFAACSDPSRARPPAEPPDAPAPSPTLYALHSQLDLASDLPGKVGDALGDLIAATDDPDDPTRYIVDQIIAQMSDGTAKDLAQAAEPLVTAYVNERLLASSPRLLPTLVALGAAFGDAARNFGTMDTLEIGIDGSVTHAIVGVRVELDGSNVELAFADHGQPTVSAAVTMHTGDGRMSIDRHALYLSLGRMLRLVIDGAIILHVSPGSVDLGGMLQTEIDCTSIGGDMASALGFGSADAYAAACRDALGDIATAFYGELAATDDDALELDLTGSASAVATFGTGRIENIDDGTWTGTVIYAGTPAPLAGGTFSGVRVE